MKRFLILVMVVYALPGLQTGAMASGTHQIGGAGPTPEEILENLLGKPQCNPPVLGGPFVEDGLITVNAELICRFDGTFNLELCIDQLVPATSIAFTTQCTPPIIKEDDNVYAEFSIPCRPGRFRPWFHGLAGTDRIDDHGDILDIDVRHPECIVKFGPEIRP